MKSPPKGQEIGIGKPQVATALTGPGRDIVIKVTQIHKVHSQHTFLTGASVSPRLFQYQAKHGARPGG